MKNHFEPKIMPLNAMMSLLVFFFDDNKCSRLNSAKKLNENIKACKNIFLFDFSLYQLYQKKVGTVIL